MDTVERDNRNQERRHIRKERYAQTLKHKRDQKHLQENDIRSLDTEPNFMDWHIDLVKREHLDRSQHERSDLTPLGEKLLLGHLVKEELSRHYFMDFVSLPDTRAKWTRYEMQDCFPEIKHLISHMIDFEMSYKGAVFKINMKRKDPLGKAVDKFCPERGLSNDGHRLFLPGDPKGNG